MAARMAGHVEHRRCRVAELEGVAVTDRDVDAGYSRSIGKRPDDDRLGRRLQLEIAAGMVRMVVRVDDVGEGQAAALERGQHRRRFRRIDGADRAAGGLAQQIDVIVAQRGNELDFERHGGRLTQFAARATLETMFIDVVDLRDFYERRLGSVARQMIRRRIGVLWPDFKGLNILGLGYATPFLRPFLSEAERVVALMPAPQGVLPWPRQAPNRAALTDESDLPLPNFSMDRVLLVHGLEFSEQVRPLLR